MYKDIPLPTLQQEHTELMDAEFTEGEVLAAIKSLNPSKAPGPDGFTGHYYRKFAAILTPHLCSFFNAIRIGNSLSLHENEALIQVIPKPGKDHGDPANYRPISLINVDIKLMTKVLATRMNSFLAKYIHPDQVGFVPNRQAPDQTRRAIDIIAALNSNWDNLGPRRGMILSLDLCKAFDSVTWEYIYYRLRRYGFGPHFLNILQVLYKTPTAKIQIKGYKSHTINIHRGTRQGCPLSPILFILALEPLAIKLRNHQDIKGICCGDEEQKCSLFADDILMFLSSPITSLPNLYRVLRRFTAFSGLTINHSKSEALNLTLEPQTVQLLQKSFQFRWQQNKLPYLGIFLTNNLQTLYQANYPPLYKKLSADLLSWAKNPPSWFGRLYSIKMNILPRLLYLFRTLPIAINRHDLKVFQKKIMQFIWGNTRPRVNQQTLYAPRIKGGLGVPNLVRYFEAAQLAQLIRTHSGLPQPSWMKLESSPYPTKPISHLMWLHMKDRPIILCPTLSFSLSLWDRLQKPFTFRSPHAPLAPLTGNPEFTPGLNPQRLLWWTNKGLIRIADLCDHRGILSKQFLIEKYQLPNTELYHYVQIVHFLKTLQRKADIMTFTPMEYLCRSFDKHKGHISNIYGIFSSKSEKLFYMQKWEQDIEETMEMDTWYNTAQLASKGYINTSLIEANYKVLLRWYMVPARIATYIPGASPLCFRGCGGEGTIYHTWWSCPKVRRYWIRIYNFIYSLTQVNLTKSPQQALLGCPLEGVPRYTKKLISFVFTAARIAIARSWRKPLIPFELVKAKLTWIMINERLSAILLDKQRVFDRIWEPWLTYLSVGFDS